MLPFVNTTVTFTIDPPYSGFRHHASYPYIDLPRRRPWTVLTGAMPFQRELRLLEVRAGLGVVALCL
jgi:hypothetical protein